MAGVAHDLRTPLTALHGHLEALSHDIAMPAPERRRVLNVVLAQSDKVRRLSQQMFELAALQSTTEIPLRERFRLDELVADSVSKFQPPGVSVADPGVRLVGEAPGALEVEGDLQLVERAITNLIDNALRHGQTATPVKVSLNADGQRAQVVVEDDGPGLPPDLHGRLADGRSLRDPPVKRSSGGIGGFGGFGLAIAQRVALLHGGSLQPLPSPAGGTRLCLTLPLAR
jgi:signal transduction histidine kinase